MKRQLSFNNKEVHVIYFVSNSAISLFKMMRDNYFVQNELAQMPATDLINEFLERAGDTKQISSDDMAELYAIFVAITFHDGKEVDDFFSFALSIKHEWFAEIAQYYLSNYTPLPNYKVYNLSPAKPQPKQNTDPAENIIFQEGKQHAL